jgi:hypothetical protein
VRRIPSLVILLSMRIDIMVRITGLGEERYEAMGQSSVAAKSKGTKDL